MCVQCDVSRKDVMRRSRVPSLSSHGEEEKVTEEKEHLGFSLSRYSSDIVKKVSVPVRSCCSVSHLVGLMRMIGLFDVIVYIGRCCTL